MRNVKQKLMEKIKKKNEKNISTKSHPEQEKHLIHTTLMYHYFLYINKKNLLRKHTVFGISI